MLSLFSLMTLSALLAEPLDDPKPKPSPIAAWATGPTEARIRFDRPVDPAIVKSLTGASIEFSDREDGEIRRAALRIASASLEPDARVVVMFTDPHPRNVRYSLKANGWETSYDLSGIEVAWDSGAEDATPTRLGSIPGPVWKNLEARLSIKDSQELKDYLSKPGRLSLRGLIPYPKGPAKLRVACSSPFEVRLAEASAESTSVPGGSKGARDRNVAEVVAESRGDELDFELTIKTPGGPLALSILDGATGKPPERVLLPWVPPSIPSVPAAPTPAALLSGGNPAKGEAIFFGDQAKCSNCHKRGGRGGEVGPDLAESHLRDRAWLYRQINEPSASLRPDYPAYTVILKDGRVAAGTVRAEAPDLLRVTDTDAKIQRFKRNEVEELRPSATSIMPVGLGGVIGESGMRDLLAYLTSPANGR